MELKRSEREKIEENDGIKEVTVKQTPHVQARRIRIGFRLLSLFRAIGKENI